MRFRPTPRRTWEIKITTPDGTLVDIDDEQLYFIWKYGGKRTNDGYADLLTERHIGVHVWIRPAGWTEPDRAAQLDGTAALPERYQR